MESTPRWTSTGLKVIAFELGLIIAILTWIAFDGLPWSKPPQALVLPEITDQSVGLVSSIYQPVQRRDDQVDYLVDDLASEQWQAGGDDVDAELGYDTGYDTGYDQGFATTHYVAPQGILFQPGGAPDTVGIFPEPVLWNDYYYPSSYGAGYGYYQPSQVVVISNSRSSNRGRQTTRRSHGPRRTHAAARPQSRQSQQARVSPRRQRQHALPRPNSLSYGHVARQRPANVSRQRPANVSRQRPANVSRGGRTTPGRAAPAQRSNSGQKQRARPQR